MRAATTPRGAGGNDALLAHRHASSGHGGSDRDYDARMGKTVAILQSNYVPWKGYFDLMRQDQQFHSLRRGAVHAA